MAVEKEVVPRTPEEAVEAIERQLINIREDLPKITDGVAKAARRVRVRLQTIIKVAKEGRRLILEKSKKEDQ